jgi:hypothetical protein
MDDLMDILSLIGEALFFYLCLCLLLIWVFGFRD